MNGLRNRTPVTTQNGPLNPIKEWPAVPGDSVPANVNWRKWTKRIQQETDPQKVFALARQLLPSLTMKNCLEVSLRKQDSIVPRTWGPLPSRTYSRHDRMLLQARIPPPSTLRSQTGKHSDKAVALYEVSTAPFLSIQRDCPQQHHS